MFPRLLAACLALALAAAAARAQDPVDPGLVDVLRRFDGAQDALIAEFDKLLAPYDLRIESLEAILGPADPSFTQSFRAFTPPPPTRFCTDAPRRPELGVIGIGGARYGKFCNDQGNVKGWVQMDLYRLSAGAFSPTRRQALACTSPYVPDVVETSTACTGGVPAVN